MRSHRALAVAASAIALLLALPAFAAAGSYVVVLKSGRTASGLKAVKAAGGKAVAVNRKVGVATVRASKASFAKALRATGKVSAVGRNGYFDQPSLQPTKSYKALGDAAPSPSAAAAACSNYYTSTFGAFPAGPEPLSPCQWDMRQIHATTAGSYAVNQGAGARVGIIDTGLDLTHPDIAPNLDLADSCSFLTAANSPNSIPAEQATSCDDKSKVQDYDGHGTHVGGTVAAPINNVGVSGVAPQAKIAGLHAGNANGYFFTQPVVDALTWAGDRKLDVVNMSFYADPYLYNCRNDADQKAIIQAIARASAYADKRGVVQVSAAGNEFQDLTHPTSDSSSPDYPDGDAVDRVVHRNCIVLPDQLPHVITISSTGPAKQLAFYSNYGQGQIEFTAPGGSSTQASNPYGRVLNAYTSTKADPGSDAVFTNPTRRVESSPTGPYWGWIQGTSMASPHAAGVAALIRARHPGYSVQQVIAALRKTAEPLACPSSPDPYFAGDVPEPTPTCRGGAQNNSFYGAGLTDAAAAGSY